MEETGTGLRKMLAGFCFFFLRRKGDGRNRYVFLRCWKGCGRNGYFFLIFREGYGKIDTFFLNAGRDMGKQIRFS